MAVHVPYSTICLLLLILRWQNCIGITGFNSLSQGYPSGSLACKVYNASKMDCSHRRLVNTPVLDKNWITRLDLSHNQLAEIHGAPFRNLTSLASLFLSSSTVSFLNSTVFKGLKSLVKLDLFNNRLLSLSSDVFSDLSNLIYLDMRANTLFDVPSEALASLHAIQYLYILYAGSTLDTVLSDFHSLTELRVIEIQFRENVTNTTFLPLAGLRIQEFQCTWVASSAEDCFWDKTAFAPFTSVKQLFTEFRALPALESIHSSLDFLTLISWSKFPSILHNTTFQDMWKVREFLTTLRLYLLGLRRIENDAFRWTPNLIYLYIYGARIETLAKYSFRELNSLLYLNLGNNKLTKVPYNALKFIGKIAPLQYLDLSSNSISSIADDAFAGLTSLTYLNIEIKSSEEHAVYTPWLNVLKNLEHFIMGDLEFLTPFITIDLPLPLSSVQTFEMRTSGIVNFKSVLCPTFPNLKSIAIFNANNILAFPFNLALHECSFLERLDLSGSLTKSINHLQHTNISMISIPTLEELTLSRNKLESIAQILFVKAPNLTLLDISDNLIKIVDSKIGHAFKYLTHLRIDDNALISLSGLERLTFLKHLNAARNQITEVPIWLISTTNAPDLITLDLSDNPFGCTCDIETFRKWIDSDTNTWLQTGLYNCATPKCLLGISVSEVELDCRSYTAFYISVSIPFAILFCVLIIFLIRYRWHIKYKLFLLYRNYYPFPENNEDFEMLRLQYHAYIAYNETSEDDAWVMNELQPNMEEGPEPVHLCIKSRDFIPGHSLIASISDNIQQSRKTILVLSPDFVESEWCYHEMEMAKMRLLDENLDVIVLVLLKDIPNNKITLSLRQLLCKKEYLKWPKDRPGQRLFWQRLRQELKAPVRIDRRFCM